MRKLDPETAQQISELAERPSFQKLADLMESQRDEYMAAVARALTTTKVPVDQREIDRKYGFWQGVMWVTRDFPKAARRDWAQWIDKVTSENEESDQT